MAKAPVPTTTTIFAATTPENTPLGYRASTSTNPNYVISPAFVEANYETLESLLRDQRSHGLPFANSNEKPPIEESFENLPQGGHVPSTFTNGNILPKNRPNGKLIHNSIINGPYVRRIILKPGDPNREVPVNKTFHVQTDDKLTDKELKQIEADDQVIQTILLGLPEDIYATVDSCETA
nr:hypothetical protein [Tanacetum cinerariifolium]